MSDNLKHAIGTLAAGALAFGSVFAVWAIAPNSDGHAGSESGDSSDSGSEALVAAELVGRWQAAKPANQDAFVEFTDYGLWFASDGCNGLDGTWSVGDDGALEIAGSTAMTLIACDNVAIPTSVSQAVSAVVDGGDLVLTTAEGDSMDLVRTRDTGVSLVGTWVPSDPMATGGAQIEFTSESEWSATDGCNSTTGTWSLGPAEGYGEASMDSAPLHGAFTADGGRWTKMACGDLDEVPISSLLHDATFAGFIDEDHVMLLGSSDGGVDAAKSLTLERQ